MSCLQKYYLVGVAVLRLIRLSLSCRKLAICAGVSPSRDIVADWWVLIFQGESFKNYLHFQDPVLPLACRKPLNFLNKLCSWPLNKTLSHHLPSHPTISHSTQQRKQKHHVQAHFKGRAWFRSYSPSPETGKSTWTGSDKQPPQRPYKLALNASIVDRGRRGRDSRLWNSSSSKDFSNVDTRGKPSLYRLV